MTSPTCSRLFRKVSCLISLQQRQFQGTSSLSKKEYEYDLDSLVQWKQETKLLFGPQRKLTKTGKLRKVNKKQEKQCLENLETLSTISNKDVDYSSENVSKNFSSTNFIEGQVSESTWSVSDHRVLQDIQKLSPEKDVVKRKRMKVPERLGETKNSHSRKRTTNFYTSQTDAKVMSLSKGDHTSDLSEIPKWKNHNPPNSNKDKPYRTQFTHCDDVEIPTIEPIPSKKETVTLKKSLMPAMANLPIEAPESFEIVTKFPLAASEIPDPVKTQLHSFKLDVEKMALRVLPSVKTILNKTMPELNRFFLNRWRESMIKELGEEGFQKYKNETMRQGTNLHANIMEFLSGKSEKELQIMPENEGHWSSLHGALESVADIRALEMDVLHPALLYRGVFDCVARYKDLLCVIDWKVSKKPRPLLKNTYDDPLQVAAYVGALNASGHYIKQHGEINHGLIVVAYPDGSPAHIHMMSRAQVEHYWLEWTTRLHSFYTLTYTEKCGQKHQAGSASGV